MRKVLSSIACMFLIQVCFVCANGRGWAQAQTTAYSSMAPVESYLIPEEGSEFELARSAAPPSISDGAEVMVLRRDGYAVAAKGTNGFVCIVERSWGADTTHPEFWNPKVRAPICFNAAAAKTTLPIYLMKTKLVLAGKSKSEIIQAVDLAFNQNELPALAPGAMCYMMSKKQYLTDAGKNWHPHLMFFVQGSVSATWGADLPGSPVMAADDPEGRQTVFLVWVGTWSDGTPGPPMQH